MLLFKKQVVEKREREKSTHTQVSDRSLACCDDDGAPDKEREKKQTNKIEGKKIRERSMMCGGAR